MFRFVDHTGELELELEAETEEGVFEEALEAFRELLEEHAPEGIAHTQLAIGAEVNAHAPDRATLLAQWLEELVVLAEKSFVPTRIKTLELGEQDLHATLEGYGLPTPHLVKAVTYHRLEFEPAGKGWRGRVVFDV